MPEYDIPEIDRLRAKSVRLEGELRSLVDGVNDRATDARFKQAIREYDANKRALDVLEARAVRIEAIRNSAYTEHDGYNGPEIMIRADAVEPHDAPTLSRGEARDGAMRILDDRYGTEHLTDEARARLDHLFREQSDNCNGSYIAKRTVITESPAYRNAWTRLVTEPWPLLTAEEVGAVRALEDLERSESRAMAEGTPSAGGYGVPVFIDASIIPSAEGSLNPMRKISRVEQITTNVWKGVSSAGVTWSYDAEGAAVSDDTPTLVQPTCTIYDARGFVPWSISVGMDYPNFAEEMSKLLARGLDELQASAFVTGNGTSAPKGILTALDSATTTHVTMTTAGTMVGGDVNKVWKSLPDRAKSGATWVMSHGVGDQVATFGNSANLSFVTVDLTQVIQTLRARPVEFSSYFADYSTTSGVYDVCVVGSFEDYLICDRIGMSVELVPHLLDQATGRPTGQRGWLAFVRHGATTLVDDNFRLLVNA